VGRWRGSAILTNTTNAKPCRYEAKADPPGVTLEVRSKGGVLSATLTLDLPAQEGCPALQESLEATEVTVNGRRLSFVGPPGHTWNLAKRQNSLQGLVSGSAGTGNLRLDGEVSLSQAPSASESVSTRKGGASAKAIGAFLGVNIVAAGAIIGVNQLGKSAPNAGKATCSPRDCIITAPGAPCMCNTEILAGGSCGNTASGVAYRGLCNVNAGLPCEATLSCNNGVCDIRDGSCPF
jgi:hypothetical protein